VTLLRLLGREPAVFGFFSFLGLATLLIGFLL